MNHVCPVHTLPHEPYSICPASSKQQPAACSCTVSMMSLSWLTCVGLPTSLVSLYPALCFACRSTRVLSLHPETKLAESLMQLGTMQQHLDAPSQPATAVKHCSLTALALSDTRGFAAGAITSTIDCSLTPCTRSGYGCHQVLPNECKLSATAGKHVSALSS